MSEKQRQALLALPDTEDAVVRHHILDAADLAAVAEARTPEIRQRLRALQAWRRTVIFLHHGANDTRRPLAGAPCRQRRTR
jgi:hypothetical protein